MNSYKNNLERVVQLVCMGFFILCSNSTMASDLAVSESSPGRGIIPQVSQHYKTQPSFYDLNQMPSEQIASGVERRFIMGTQSSLIRWDLKAGTVLPVHFHLNEQITRVEKGELAVYSQGQKYTLMPGQVMVFPPNVPHEFVAMRDVVIIEQHTPARQDFINGDFEKMMNDH